MMKKSFLKQFLKFAVVGCINTLINLFVLYVLTEFFGIYYLISAVFAFVVAVGNSFVMNKLWTFEEKFKDNTLKKSIKFYLVSIAALLVNLFFLYFFTEIIGFYYLLSQIFAIAISLWINFLGNKFWTFKRK